MDMAMGGAGGDRAWLGSLLALFKHPRCSLMVSVSCPSPPPPRGIFPASRTLDSDKPSHAAPGPAGSRRRA